MENMCVCSICVFYNIIESIFFVFALLENVGFLFRFVWLA